MDESHNIWVSFTWTKLCIKLFEVIPTSPNAWEQSVVLSFKQKWFFDERCQPRIIEVFITIKTIWGRFHQHFCPTFAGKQNEKLILANGVWRMAHRFGKRRTDFSLVSHAGLKRQWLVKLNGEFFAKHYAPESFRLANKVWWNRPLVLFSQN